MKPTTLTYPKLRALDVHPIAQNGQQGFLLRDPLQLCEQSLVVPRPLHLILPLCDGTREDARALSASLAVRYQIRIAPATIDQLLGALDQVCLLENETYVRATAQARDAYRAAPSRSPATCDPSPRGTGRRTRRS